MVGCNNVPDNVNIALENVNQASEDVKKNINKNVDIQDLEIYTSEEIGIKFKYPAEYLEPVVEIVDGKITLTLKQSTDSYTNAIYIIAATSDYEPFMESIFSGKEPIEDACINPLEYSNVGAVCVINNYGNHQAVFRNSYGVAECSFSFGTSIEMNNQSNTEYSGIEFATALSDVNEEIESIWTCDMDPEADSLINDLVKKNSENIINKHDLSKSDLQLLEDLEYIVESVEFID